MPLPQELTQFLCANRLTYFEPKEWDAPSVKRDTSNATDGFTYENSLTEPRIKKVLSDLGYESDSINLTYSMKITVPFINIGIFVIVVAMMD